MQRLRTILCPGQHPAWPSSQGQPRGDPPAIEEVCRDHAGRLDEARRLIEVLESLDGLIAGAGDPMQESGGAGQDVTPLPDEISTSSRYRAVRAHARGGLGEVFIAR